MGKSDQNPTPQWPVDMDCLIRKAGVRSAGNQVINKWGAIAQALTDIGHDTSVWMRSFRVHIQGEMKEKDIFVLISGDNLIGAHLDTSWEQAINRAMTPFSKSARQPQPTEEDKQNAHWVMGAQALNYNAERQATEDWKIELQNAKQWVSFLQLAQLEGNTPQASAQPKRRSRL